MKIVSPQFALIKQDWIAAGKRGIVFLAPFLVVIIPVIVEKLPTDWAYSAIVLFLLNRLTDILRRYVVSTTYVQ